MGIVVCDTAQCVTAVTKEKRDDGTRAGAATIKLVYVCTTASTHYSTPSSQTILPGKHITSYDDLPLPAIMLIISGTCTIYGIVNLQPPVLPDSVLGWSSSV
jgi:hypothetical protein